MIVLSLGISITSLIYSFLKYHQKRMALILAAFGFSMVLFSQFLGDEIERGMMIFGAIVVAISHLINMTHCKKCI